MKMIPLQPNFRIYEIVIPRASVDADEVDKLFEITLFLTDKTFSISKTDDSATVLTESEAEIFNRTPETNRNLLTLWEYIKEHATLTWICKNRLKHTKW
jgi:hypothetical protein